MALDDTSDATTSDGLKDIGNGEHHASGVNMVAGSIKTDIPT